MNVLVVADWVLLAVAVVCAFVGVPESWTARAAALLRGREAGARGSDTVLTEEFRALLDALGDRPRSDEADLLAWRLDRLTVRSRKLVCELMDTDGASARDQAVDELALLLCMSTGAGKTQSAVLHRLATSRRGATFGSLRSGRTRYLVHETPGTGRSALIARMMAEAGRSSGYRDLRMALHKLWSHLTDQNEPRDPEADWTALVLASLLFADAPWPSRASLLRELPWQAFRAVESAVGRAETHLFVLTRRRLGELRAQITRALTFPANAALHPPGALMTSLPRVTRGPTASWSVLVMSVSG